MALSVMPYPFILVTIVQFVYPLYCYFDRIVKGRTLEQLDYEQWTIYWIICAVWMFLEMQVLWVLIDYFPLFLEIKLLFFLWLSHPDYKGALFLWYWKGRALHKSFDDKYYEDAFARLRCLSVGVTDPTKRAKEVHTAFVFIKPHAVTPQVKNLVKQTFAGNGLTIVSERAISAEDIIKKGLLDIQPDQCIYTYQVEWDASKLSWGDFREKVFGSKDPSAATPGSLRNKIYKEWKMLDLDVLPDTGNNGVHASASPFEGLVERNRWLDIPLTEDYFGEGMAASGIPLKTIEHWCSDPALPFEGKNTSLFDLLEGLDGDECLKKAVAIHKGS